MTIETNQNIPKKNINDSIEKISQSLLGIERNLQNIEELLRIIAEPICRKFLSQIFDNPQKLRVYELADGLRSTRDIAKIMGGAQKTVSRWLRDMDEQYQIVEKAGDRGQYRKKYQIMDLLLKYPVDQTEETNGGNKSENEGKWNG